MSLNVDAYRRSTFFFKDRNQPINAGPVWDMNLGYGNGARRDFRDWIFPQYTFWKRMMCNYKLTSLVIQRWKTLRQGPWSDESITQFIDASAAPIDRQIKKCPVFWARDVVQCAAVDISTCNMTYDATIKDLKESVLNRSHWMDERITQLYKPLDGDQCSFVGTLPKYNCAADGNDDGCLKEPEKYYNAVKFPAVRTPYDGAPCGAGRTDPHSANFALTPYEKPSADYCWQSSGLTFYPKMKGVRERTLTPFCNGYGTCAQGPNAKCECAKGVLVEPESCRRIDAEEDGVGLAAVERPSVQSSLGTGKASHALFGGAFGLGIMALLVAAVFRVRTNYQQRQQQKKFNSYRPVSYGSVEDYRRFSSAPRI